MSSKTKRNGHTFRKGNSVKIMFAFHLKRELKGKHLLPLRENSFLSENIPFQNVFIEQESKQKSQNCLPYKSLLKIYHLYPDPVKRIQDVFK